MFFGVGSIINETLLILFTSDGKIYFAKKNTLCITNCNDLFKYCLVMHCSSNFCRTKISFFQWFMYKFRKDLFMKLKSFVTLTKGGFHTKTTSKKLIVFDSIFLLLIVKHFDRVLKKHFSSTIGLQVLELQGVKVQLFTKKKKRFCKNCEGKFFFYGKIEFLQDNPCSHFLL